MNIWIVNPFDPLPGEPLRPGRYGFIGELLSQRGHKVTWWTSNFFHMRKTFRCRGSKEVKVNSNFRIIYLQTPYYKKNVSLRRAWNHVVYAREFFKKALSFHEKPDVILASSPPLASAKASILVAKKKGAKCIIDVQDLWPEAFELLVPSKTRFLAKFMLYPLKRLAASIYNSSDAIIGVSRTFVERALRGSELGKPFMILPLCVDMKIYKNLENQISENRNPFKKIRGEFWCTYIGTVGNTYDLNTILEAANLLAKSHPYIKFFIAGEGPELERLKEIKRSNRIENVIFTGFLNIKNLIALLKQSDVGLNTYIGRATQTLPNKIFDYMALGLPIISSLKGEFENLLKSENIGIQYEAGNAHSLKEAILELYCNPQKREFMGRNARIKTNGIVITCLLYTSPSPRD